MIDFWKVCPPNDEATLEEMLRISAEYERVKDNPDWEWDLLLFIKKMGLTLNQVQRALESAEAVNDQ